MGEEAARIARLCYVQMEQGKMKPEVLCYRDELYKKCCPTRRRSKADFNTEEKIEVPDSEPENNRGEMVCRNLFGQRVVVSTGLKEVPRRTMIPWAELEPSDVERFTADDAFHYEKELGLTFRRSREERLERLERMGQKSTLPHLLPGSPPASTSDGCLESLQDFFARPEFERRLVTYSELKRLERLAFLQDNEVFTLNERRSRLLELLWASRAECPCKGPSFFETWSKAKDSAKVGVMEV